MASDNTQVTRPLGKLYKGPMNSGLTDLIQLPVKSTKEFAGKLTIGDSRYSFKFDSTCFRVPGLNLPEFYFLRYHSGNYSFKYYKKGLSDTSLVESLEDQDIIGTITLTSKGAKAIPAREVNQWLIRIDLSSGCFYFHAMMNEWSLWGIVKKM